MKKIISAIVAFASAAACAIGASAADALAAAVQSESGQLEGLDEISLGDVGLMDIDIDIPNVLSNHSDSSYNYGDYLDKNNRAIYDALQSWIEPTLDGITVTLPERVSVVLSAIPGTSDFTEEDQDKFNEAIVNSCNPGIVTTLFDTPEIFWVSPKDILFGVDGASYTYNPFKRNYTIYFTKIKLLPALSESLADLNEALEYKALYEEAAETFVTRGSTRYETLRNLHDNIVKFTYYDVDARFLDNMLGAFVEPGVVCEGYSEAFKYFCDRLNIPCVCVYGNIDEEQNAAHMWNYVQMDDGEWYGVDLTWDDRDGKNNIQFTRNYFLKGSKTFNTNHFAESDYVGTTLVYPTLAVNNYDASNAVPEPTTVEETTAEPTTIVEETTAEPTTTVEETTAEPTTTVVETTAEPTTTFEETTPELTTTAEETTTAPEPETAPEETTTPEPITEPETETTPEKTTSEPIYLRGDFNRDGAVNVADLVLCARAVVGASDVPCDYNEDGVTNSIDMIFMRKILFTDFLI